MRNLSASPEGRVTHSTVNPGVTVRVVLVTSLPCDVEIVGQLADGFEWPLAWVRTCGQLPPILELPGPKILLTCDRLPDGDWRRVMRISWEFTDQPPAILVAASAGPRLAYQARTRGVGWLLERPLNAFALTRSLVQAWRRATAPPFI